jgi:hypothetical protein
MILTLSIWWYAVNFSENVSTRPTPKLLRECFYRDSVCSSCVHVPIGARRCDKNSPKALYLSRASTFLMISVAKSSVRSKAVFATIYWTIIVVFLSLQVWAIRVFIGPLRDILLSNACNANYCPSLWYHICLTLGMIRETTGSSQSIRKVNEKIYKTMEKKI